MKEITQIENYRVEIWRRPYQRTMNLRVRPDGLLRVTCGRRMALHEITRFISESKVFIQKRMLEVEAMRARYPHKEMVSGEIFLFFGERRVLEVIWSWNARPRMSAGELALEMLAPVSSSVEERRKAMRMFFRKQASLHLPERVSAWATRMSLHPRSVSIRGQRTRWGSCSASGAINLNWKLLAAPEHVIDYVVIHELAHIKYLDHSAKFWGLVAEHCPEWKSARDWLRENEYEIGVQFGA